MGRIEKRRRREFRIFMFMRVMRKETSEEENVQQQENRTRSIIDTRGAHPTSNNNNTKLMVCLWFGLCVCVCVATRSAASEWARQWPERKVRKRKKWQITCHPVRGPSEVARPTWHYWLRWERIDSLDSNHSRAVDGADPAGKGRDSEVPTVPSTSFCVRVWMCVCVYQRVNASTTNRK